MRCYVSGHFCNSFNDVVSQAGYKPVSFAQLFASKLDMFFKSVIFIYLFPQICCHLLYVVNLSPIVNLSFVF